MSYLVCHFGKYKSGNVFGLQKHNQRENENYSNKDIDKAKIALNYDLINQHFWTRGVFGLTYILNQR